MPNYVVLPNQNLRTAINPLAYMGTEATTPPQFTIQKRAPTSNDYQEFSIGHLWLHEHTEDLWYLSDKNTSISGTFEKAHWVNLSAGGDTFMTDDLNYAYPSNLGQVNVFGGLNMGTEAVSPNQDTITINLDAHPVLPGGLTITPLGAPGVVTTNGVGLLNSTNGTDGQIIVARPAGPSWVDLVSADASVIISESIDPLHPGGIDLKAAGGGPGGITKLEGNDGLTVTPDAITGIIKVLGDDVLWAERTALDTLTLGINDSPNNGDIIIGGGAGVDSAWGRLTSTGGSVTITNPGPNQINIEAAGIAALTGLEGDVGVATPVAGLIKLAGDTDFINTSAAGKIVSFGLNLTTGAGVDGKILIGNSLTGKPQWANIIGAGGIAVTNNHGSITLTGGGGGGGGIVTLDCDANVATDPGTHVIRIEGGANSNIDHVAHPYINIHTEAPVAGGDLVQIKLASSIQLPLTNAGGTAGVIMIDVNDFAHAYGTRNAFLGTSAGNRTLTTATSYDNTAVGFEALRAITANSRYNTAVGSYALRSSVSPLYCTAIGYKSQYLQVGDYNTSVGYLSMGEAALASANNVAVGYRALAAISGGSGRNIAIGSGSLDDATTATENCVLGTNAATAISTSPSNVILGDSAASQLLTGSGFNVLIGKNAGDNLVTGAYNVCLGQAVGPVGAGSSLTLADSKNILINHPGVAGDVSTTRIGDDTANYTTKCYLGGVYNKTITTTQHPVAIDSTGKLGKYQAIGLEAYIATAGFVVTGDDTKYYFGTTSGALGALTAIQNIGGGTFVVGGAGTPASYTVPTGGTGMYMLTMTVKLYGLTPPIPPYVPPPHVTVDPMTIEVTRIATGLKDLYSYDPNLNYNGYDDTQSMSMSQIITLYAGDIVKWYLQIDYRPTADKTIAGRRKSIGFSTSLGGGGADLWKFTNFGIALFTRI